MKHRQDEEWHERIVTAIGEYPLFAGLTPHEDHYVHNAEEDLSDIEEFGPRGGVPPRIRGSGAMIVRFGLQYTPAQLQAIFAEGEQVRSS